MLSLHIQLLQVSGLLCVHLNCIILLNLLFIVSNMYLYFYLQQIEDHLGNNDQYTRTVNAPVCSLLLPSGQCKYYILVMQGPYKWLCILQPINYKSCILYKGLS